MTPTNRAEWEAGAGLVDGERFAQAIGGNWKAQWACRRSKLSEWIGAVALVLVGVATIRRSSPQETIEWFTDLIWSLRWVIDLGRKAFE